jgi:hypothetical protein
MAFLYIIKPFGSADFKFGISDDPAARLHSYRTMSPRGFEVVHVLRCARAADVELCLRHFLAARGVLLYHETTGRPSEMAKAGADDFHLTAALEVAVLAGGERCESMPARQSNAAREVREPLSLMEQEEADGKRALMLEDYIMHDASKRRLLKGDGIVYYPVPDQSGVYARGMSYKRHLNAVFKQRDAPKKVTPLEKSQMHLFLTDYVDLPLFPQLLADPTIILK